MLQGDVTSNGMGSVDTPPKDWIKVVSGECVFSRRKQFARKQQSFIKLLEVTKRKLM